MARLSHEVIWRRIVLSLAFLVLAWQMCGEIHRFLPEPERCWLSWTWQFPARPAAEAEPTRSLEAHRSNLRKSASLDLGASWAKATSVGGRTATHFIAPAHVPMSAGAVELHMALVVSIFLVCMVLLRGLRFYFSGGPDGLPSLLRRLGHWSLSQDTVIATLAQPGRPDALFGSLCLFSNVFFAALAGFFWRHRKKLELIWMALVTAASTIYHYYQLHPHCGPLDHLTSGACMVDVTLSVSFGLYVASRYPGRKKALAVCLAALGCFVLPSLLPAGRIAEVAYSLLHSAWHGLAAAAAYICVQPSMAARGGRTSKQLVKMSAFLMNHQSVGRKILLGP